MKKLPTTLLSLLFALSSARADMPELVGEVERLGTGMAFTEGSVWIPAENRLVFSDIPNSRQMEWTAAGGVKEWRKVESSNGNLLDLEGLLLSCQHGGRNVVRTEKDGSVTVLADAFEGKKLNSPNDLAIKSDGSIWFTDPSYGLKGREVGVAGKWVYRVVPGGEVSLLCKTFDMPNGIAFSPDEKRVYISDTGKVGKIRAYAVVDTGLLGEPLFEIDVRCDGMCIDTEGRLYATAGGGVHVFDKDGKKLGVIETPEHPANVCFGGEDFDTLFITARKSLYSVKIKAQGATVPQK